MICVLPQDGGSVETDDGVTLTVMVTNGTASEENQQI